MTKHRNRLLAVLCLMAFAGLGVIYFRSWVVQKPFGIVLILGDGMVGSKLAAARLYQGGADQRLALEGFPHVAILSNYANDFAVPDAAAASTALACGVKTNNGSLGVDEEGEPVVSLARLAKGRGRAVGLVTNGQLTDPGLAAFYARASGGTPATELAAQLVDGEGFDLLLGGGRSDFLPDTKEGVRDDGRDLLLDWRRKGYELLRTRSELDNTPVWKQPKLVGLFADGPMPYADSGPQGDLPGLADMVRSAIGLLQYHRGGYLLVVDASLVGRASAANEGGHALAEMVEFDRAVDVARRYVGENGIVIAAGRRSVGGMVMNGYPLRRENGVSLLGVNSAGIPSITWSTGPRATPAGGVNEPPRQGPAEPVMMHRPEAAGTVEDVLAVGVGPGTEALVGFGDNTIIHRILAEQL